MSDKKQLPYNEAVKTGQYAKKTGLYGKYDNVRRFWEDEVTRLFIRPFLKDMVEKKAGRLKRLRILDLGCGTGDGYDLLMGITAKDVGLYEYAVNLLNSEQLGYYKGVDINDELIEQAREYCGLNGKVVFERMDCSGGLDIEEDPFDVYFASYGTVSHFNAGQTARILSDIAGHCEDKALVIMDWLGRYSYEWQDLWGRSPDEELFMDYRISYIYPPEERDKVEIQSFPLKLVSRDEVRGIVDEAARISGVEIEIRRFFERSVFVGRHMDTAEYNRHCPPIREAVNALLEPNMRTDLNSLMIDYIPREGFYELNKFFEHFSGCWNTLVKHTIGFLAEYREGAEVERGGADLYRFYPEPLRKAVHTMEEVVNTTGNLPGDSRANIIEPQLAYALRRLEMELHSGLGTGHGLVCVMEINKKGGE